MNEEIVFIMKALEKSEVHIVNDYLQEKWKKDINLFIETVSSMRKYNAHLADRHFNSGEFVQNFSLR